MRRARVVTALLVPAVLVPALLTACSGGRQAAEGQSATTVATTPTPSTPATSAATSPSEPASASTDSGAPSAAADLAPFVAQAAVVDDRLRAAAARINAVVTPGTFAVDAATASAVVAADPETAFALLPAGMPPNLLDAAITVYSDLATRRAAMNAFEYPGTVSDETSDRQYAIDCLHNGSSAAAAFDGDVAALVTLAASLPPVERPAPDSAQAAELVAVGTWISLGYNGCGSCGGDPVRNAPEVTWDVAPGSGGTPAGNVRGLPFTATYTAADGWQVLFNAC